MRVAIDGTPAATQTAGVGRYTRELLRELVRTPGDRFQVLAACGDADARALADTLPPGAWRDIVRPPIPSRALTIAWQRMRLPVPVDLFLADFDLFHGPDFVLPPTRRPSVVTIHDMSFMLAPQYGEPSLVRYLSTVVPRALERASRVIAVSASVAAELASAYPGTSEKIVAIPNGVAVPDGIADKPQEASSAPRVLTVGTIEPRKNHAVLLDAMPAVWARFPDTELVIAGRVGWRSDAIIERIRRAERSSRVRLVEAPTDCELRSLYQSATVFVYPSHYEGFGLPVLEAMAHNVAVVAAGIPALRETAGNAAVFAAPDDAEAIAHAVVSLLDDRYRRLELVQAGAARVALYSWTETARRTRDTYRSAMEDPLS